MLLTEGKVCAFMLRSVNARANTIVAPIELGSSSDADGEEENDNDNDRRNDTSMDASDPSNHSRHTRKSFHAPISEGMC
jgi:hypothetical protein